MNYYRYWGKASRDKEEMNYHLLVYHSLDVAAVGSVWLDQDQALRSRISSALGMNANAHELPGLISFFLALHDFGKFDIRFQAQVPEVLGKAWTDLNLTDMAHLSSADISSYNYRHGHGKAGYDVFVKFYDELLGIREKDDDILDLWKPWVAAVTGHHGVIPSSADWMKPFVEKLVIDHDKQARREWFDALSTLFSINNLGDLALPNLRPGAVAFIAGFCSVTDWLASNELFVQWLAELMPLREYLEKTIAHCKKTDLLRKTGLIAPSIAIYAGIETLLPDDHKPRQIQTIIDDILPEPGLSIIEGPTGSGKTEAALATAWKLIAAGHADSIVFALPTQATANAMLERLQAVAPLFFPKGNTNLVLAHGNARFNKVFANIKAARQAEAIRNGDEGSVQCAEWISSSRKRVFLGQVGVCTIDQVLLSVLPIRHNFVRSFGVMKSVLIVDEVHAYDRYMYGLLEEVIKRQKIAGGSIILLSATLPANQKKELFDAWEQSSGNAIDADAHYPLISRISSSNAISFSKAEQSEMPSERTVQIERVDSKNLDPNESIIERLFAAAKKGAIVAVVCNLVQSTQRTALKLRELSVGHEVSIDIFHGRYRFKDRQKKEKIAIDYYGKKAERSHGRVLVATQVVEQSLDLDFDWLVTQLCPIDLLFQRMGRLHRHDRKRPAEFDTPLCTILSTEGDGFGPHEYIYQDVAVLWRTRELLKRKNNKIIFPEAYRECIEAVYGKLWDEEPDAVIGKSYAFKQEQQHMWYEAQQRATNGMNPFADTEQNAVSLTRGTAMALSVVPVLADERKKTLLDGESLSAINDFERDELLNMNTISVPARWKWLPSFEDGYIYLPMSKKADGWIWSNGKYSLKYTTDFGLEQWEGEE